MLISVIVFGVKVYVYHKIFDAIEKEVNKFVDEIKSSKKNKIDNEHIVETYFVD